MTIEQVNNTLKQCFECEKTSGTVIKINTGASYINGKAIDLFLEQKNDKIYLTDGKNTMKYMNDMYELKSSDVKMCISNVLKIYGFSINSGVLNIEVQNIDILTDKVFDMIMCIGQLANMFAFFDLHTNPSPPSHNVLLKYLHNFLLYSPNLYIPNHLIH